MKKFSILMLSLLTLVMASCATKKNKSDVIIPVGDTTENSVDWAGTYLGEFSNDKGLYIAVQLELKNNGTYSITTTNPDSDRDLHKEGNFKWVLNGRAIELDQLISTIDSRLIHVGENVAFVVKGSVLNPDQKLSDLPQLEKLELDDKLTEKYWKLVAINDRAITAADFDQKEPHILFKTNFNHVRGTDGCNGFGGKYKIQDGTIEFSQLISTMMACEGSFVFDHYMRILNEAKTYKVTDKELLLQSEKDVLKFEVVYLK